MGARVWAAPEPWLRHWPPVLRDVMLVHEPDPCAARPPEELERDEGLQERCLPSPEGVGRKGRAPAHLDAGRRAHDAEQGAGGLHRREDGGSLQARHLPLLGDFLLFFTLLARIPWRLRRGD